MNFDENKPIYLQIAENICERILSGELNQGNRIPSVREWAATIGVNPNTVARSYETLTERQVIYNQRGIGFFVSPDAKNTIMQDERKRFMEEELPAFLKKAELLGINIKNII
ncbi:MAG: GntR family transcriptional regulator [Bacteroidales bacterium]|nr:GntR family transcriptional regulator [Bacteroidales bacterium]